MASATSKTFRSGNSEAVRLPKEVAYGCEIELDVTRSGDVVTLRPKVMRRTPAETVALLRTLPRPTYVQEREPFEFPIRNDERG